MNLHYIGISAALVSAAAWAAGAILYKKLGERVSSQGMNLVKGLLSLVLLTAALAVAGFERIGTEALILLGVSGLLGISLGDTFFFESLRKLDAHVVVLLSMLGQVLTVFLAVVFLEETLSILMWIGVIMVIGGIAVVLYARVGSERSGSIAAGLIFGLLSVLCMSVSIIIAKKGLASVSAIQATFIRMLSGTAGMLLWGIITGRLSEWVSPFKETELIKKISVAVGVVTFGGFWLFHVAIKYIDVSIANTLNSTEPLFVIPLAAVFLRERITRGAVIGTIVSVCGVIILISGR